MISCKHAILNCDHFIPPVSVFSFSKDTCTSDLSVLQVARIANAVDDPQASEPQVNALVEFHTWWRHYES